MSNLTMADVAQYFVSYKAKYEDDCTISIDVMEQIIEGAASDDDVIEGMHNAMTSTDDDDDVTGLTATLPGTVEPGSAYDYAIKMDAELNNDLEALSNAALLMKYGAGRILDDLYRLYGQDTVDNTWPVPGTYRAGHGKDPSKRVGDNEPYDLEETTIIKPDGTTGSGTRSFYSELISFSPIGRALLKGKEDAAKITGDIETRKSDIGTFETKFNSRKAGIVRAVNLGKRMAFLNAKTQMKVRFIRDDTDGPDKGKVKKSNKCVFISDGGTKVDVITIGQLLAFKNVVEGATYASIVGTKQRKPGVTGPVVQNTIVSNIPQFDEVTAAYATFFEKLEADTKATNTVLTHLNAGGSDALILSLNTIMTGIDGFLSKPGIAKRLSGLLATGDGSKREATAKAFAAGIDGKGKAA